jgi:hypothetical protein
MNKDLSIKEFFAPRTEANHLGIWTLYDEERDWALKNCSSMQEAWDTFPANNLIFVATQSGILSNKEIRLFAVSCCRMIWHLITDHRSREAINVSEKFANGEATFEELMQTKAPVNQLTLQHASRSKKFPLRVPIWQEYITKSKPETHAAEIAHHAAWLASWCDNVPALEVSKHASEAAAHFICCLQSLETKSKLLKDLDWAYMMDHTIAMITEKHAAWLRANCKPDFSKQAQ